MRIARRPPLTVELQIGPMVDLVFLLLIFFLLQPRPDREGGFGLSLPGTAPTAAPLAFPETERIAIAADGRVTLNDLDLGAPGDRGLPRLRAVLRRFRAACDAAGSTPRIALDADDGTDAQRVADVLDACAEAGIGHVDLAASLPDARP